MFGFCIFFVSHFIISCNVWSFNRNIRRIIKRLFWQFLTISRSRVQFGPRHGIEPMCKTLIAPLSKIHNMSITQIYLWHTYVIWYIDRTLCLKGSYSNRSEQRRCARIFGTYTLRWKRIQLQRKEPHKELSADDATQIQISYVSTVHLVNPKN